MNQRVYLDYNATTPPAKEVVNAMQRFLAEAYGNPSSFHWAGRPARDAVETARSQVAALLCCDATGIVELRDAFWKSLQSIFGDQIVLHGHPKERLPNTLNVSLVGHIASEVLGDMPNVAASTGPACHAGVTNLSPVLAAMGVSPEVGLGAIRFSLGRFTSLSEIEAVAEQLTKSCNQDRR